MVNKSTLTLRIAGKKDFAVLNRILFLLVMLSTLLSPQPILLTVFVVLVTGAGRASGILCFSKVNVVKLTLVIFPDGRVILKNSLDESLARELYVKYIEN